MRVLIQAGSSYFPPAYLNNTSVQRRFQGAVDPSTVSTIGVGDQWWSTSPAGPTPPPNPEPPTSFIVTDPSMDIQSMINTAGVGATIVIRNGGTGVYQQYGRSVISPLQNQTIWVNQNVIIDGSRIVTGWTSDGAGHWSASGYLPGAYSVDSGTQSEVITGTNANLAGYMEDMFLNGARLLRVGALSNVTTGSYWQDYTNNKIWIGNDPTGQLLEMAAARTGVNITASGVTWKANGSIVQRFANAPQSGAFNVRNSGCEVTQLITRYNHAVGVYYASAGNSSRHNGGDYYNGQLGMSRYQSNLSIIDGVEFAYNNPQGLYRIMDWESGGIKTTQSVQGFIQNCTAHDNRGIGFWQDVSNRSDTFKDVQSYNNSADGVRLEISWGSQVIGTNPAAKSCYIYNNCLESVTKFDGTTTRGSDPGPFFSDEINVNDSSADANNGNKPSLIQGVVIVAKVNNNAGSNVGSSNGIFCQARPRSSGGVTWTLAINVTGNDIKVPSGGRIGAGQLSGADYSQAKYNGNTYRVVSTSNACFQNGNASPTSFATWQAAGFDATGTLIVEP